MSNTRNITGRITRSRTPGSRVPQGHIGSSERGVRYLSDAGVLHNIIALYNNTALLSFKGLATAAQTMS